ncbi:unnamed protein product [Caenorhabditis angaria]|uniref:Uncharacterized protein n=1 Tax=Caenorhabditis angaria TaxID=860376 RepID=A0A9P1MXB8_9PELO|nr:unnamed protein product [Caenorhabditis angaria]
MFANESMAEQLLSEVMNAIQTNLSKHENSMQKVVKMFVKRAQGFGGDLEKIRECDSEFAYNQITANDLSFIRYDKFQRMIADLREHVPKARAFISELAEEPRDVIAPGVDCFLVPFARLAPRALNAALLGYRDVLIELPTSDFEVQKFKLPAADVANKCCAELVALHFTCGEFGEAKKMMAKLVKPGIAHPIVNIDEKNAKLQRAPKINNISIVVITNPKSKIATISCEHISGAPKLKLSFGFRPFSPCSRVENQLSYFK